MKLTDSGSAPIRPGIGSDVDVAAEGTGQSQEPMEAGRCGREVMEHLY